ncbi:hypothetical protein [Xylophilus sp. GOD-11R]|uniref:hypothetical protein n=1 Tax=Xylophilus sp. GOD-11R TaxID=3089814 RepID=UPI00298CE513|nr:hypothetical protein [Xylophilus sp. GOD-11R]WPB55060.1 hypothetical protein R9X41_12865 [Xylophilus sp. GOD-11R]
MSAVFPALIGLAGVVVGWFINHWLTGRREEQRRRLELQVKHLERQIEELYGPLAAALYEGKRTFVDLLETLRRDHVFDDEGEISEEDLKTWLFWVDTEFLPRNHEIKQLLRSKAHLIDSNEFPESHVAFLDHSNSWAVSHRRWKAQQVPYSWHSKIEWPNDFEEEVLATFHRLKKRHARLIGALSQ